MKWILHRKYGIYFELYYIPTSPFIAISSSHIEELNLFCQSYIHSDSYPIFS